jgi:RNA polymerase sigma factor (sigma-70 family)
MSDGQRPALLAYLRQLGSAAADDSDAVLLERFVAVRDETAFAALLRRHGPLVWGVCRRVLAEEHAAEDAFQATFLVLVRKAQAVSKQASVRSFLYGVALRVALRARQQKELRRLREQSAPPRRTTETPVWQDVWPLLDEEIRRLPEKYRLPVILCYLEGQTNDEAARQLNCPRGTLAVRLARARDKLRARLVRRGLTLSAAALATLLADNALSAAVPASLAAETTKAVLAGAAPASITALAEGVLRAMFVSKIKATIAVVLALVGSAGFCTIYLHGQGQVQQTPDRFPRKGVPDIKTPAKSAQAIRKLLKDRLDAAEVETKVRYEKHLAGAQDATVDVTLGAFQRLLKAELELSEKREDRLAALERHVRLTTEIAEICQRKFDVGRISRADLAQTEYERLSAEITLERERARVEPR